MIEKENLEHKAYFEKENKLFEKLYTTHYSMPFVVFLPVSAFFSVQNLCRKTGFHPSFDMGDSHGR